MRVGFMPYKSMWYIISETRRSVITSKSANVSVYKHTYTHSILPIADDELNVDNSMSIG